MDSVTHQVNDIKQLSSSKGISSHLNKFTLSLKQHIWVIAAFLMPLAIRSVPEILSWPYPLGLDTLRYIYTIESGNVFSSVFAFIKAQLFYPLGTLAYWLTGDGVVVIKVFGPILMGLVTVMMYLYARRGLGWSGFKSFLVSFLVGIYFVSLRNSWDLYAQSIGLLFLFTTLIILKSSTSHKRYGYAFVFLLLTVFSHQLVTVILFVILGLEALRFLLKKYYRDFTYLIVSMGLAGSFFLYRLYSPSASSIVIPTMNIASEPSLTYVLSIGGLLFYCYGLLLPFVAVGLVRLKDWFLRFWVVWCLGVILVLMVFPSLPVYYWNRWLYLLVYPLLFFAVEGLDRLYSVWSKHANRIKRMAPKCVAITFVAFLLVLSSFYVTAYPENQISFFSTDNPYLAYIPSSMVQNTLSIRDNAGLVACFNWINANSANDSVLVIHYALCDLARIYVDGKIVTVDHSSSMFEHLQNETSLANDLIDASVQASDYGNVTVYTVWWVSGEGWYQIPSLPSDFKEIYHVDDMVVYVFMNEDT